MAANQCDGCMARRPFVRGMHRMTDGAYPDYMWCQRGRYEERGK